MPRFYFDVGEVSDSTGADLPDREAARAYAIGLAEIVLQRKAAEAETRSSFVQIRNEQGEVFDTIHSEET